MPDDAIERARDAIRCALMMEPPWNDLEREEKEARLAAVLQTISAAFESQQAPEGWMLVPVEPDEAMMQAGVNNNPTSWTEDTDRGFAHDVAATVWSAMLDAAPSVTLGEVG